MLFYVSFKPDIKQPQVLNKILDVLDENDLYAHIFMFSPNPDVIYKKAITHTEDNSEVWTHKKKNGYYQIVSTVNPAGKKSKELGHIVVYKDLECGNLYYREWVDFLASMKIVSEEDYGQSSN